MSYSVYTYVLIGLRVDWGKLATLLYRPARNRGCAHEEREGSFCPLCGKPKWVMSQETDPNFNEDEDTLFGWKIVSTLDIKHRTSGTPVYLATEILELSSRDTDEVLFLPFETLGKRLEKAYLDMIPKLKDLGLWEVGKFGIHAYTQENY